MFIIDQNQHLIAVDKKSLKELGFKDIYEAAQAFASGMIQIDRREKTLKFNSDKSLPYEEEELETVFGKLYLIQTSQEISLAKESAAIAKRSNTEIFAHEKVSQASTGSSEDIDEKLEALLKLLPTDEEESQTPKVASKSSKNKDEVATQLNKEQFKIKLPKNSIGEEPIINLFEDDEEPKPQSPQGSSKKESLKEDKGVESLLDQEEEILPLDEDLDIKDKAPTPKDETLSKKEQSSKSQESALEEDDLFDLALEEDGEPTAKEPQSDKTTQKQSDEELEALLKLVEEEEESPSQNEQELSQESALEDDDLFDLKSEEESPLDEDSSSQAKPQEVKEEASTPLETSDWRRVLQEFHPDLDSNATQMNLKSDEYRELIRDLIEDLRQISSQLISQDPKERHEAISILKDAIVLLQLKPLERILAILERDDNAEDREAIVASLEESLTLLVEGHLQAIQSQEQSLVESPTPTSESAAKNTKEAEVQEEALEVQEEAPKTQEKIGDEEEFIEEFLEGVKPIAISFSPQMAAEELSLPKDIVLEFIGDFAQQGHEYLPVLIRAYAQRDLDTLQKTAHMLKGAASNLRIEAMVDNLYQLQVDNDIEKAPERIRKFAGQLMSLDNFLKQLS